MKGVRTQEVHLPQLSKLLQKIWKQNLRLHSVASRGHDEHWKFSCYYKTNKGKTLDIFVDNNKPNPPILTTENKYIVLRSTLN